VSGGSYDELPQYGGVGGLIGRDFTGHGVANCYATGAVSGESYVGGLKGFSDNFSFAVNCYATGAVSGESYVGGLVGYNSYSGALGCYATGKVTGTGNYIGGLIGWKDTFMDNIRACFWDTETSGQTTSAAGVSKTTAEMKQINTFTNWDFVETWGIEDNQTYPFLKLTYPVGDLNHDKVVDLFDFAIFASHWLQGL
jgi:hypothetical protein